MNDKKVKEIKNMIVKMFEPEKPREETAALNRNRRLSIQLSKLGEPVVALIIKELKIRKSQGKIVNDEIRGRPIDHLVMVVNELAKPEHNREIAEMLVWDEITDEANRSTQAIILQTLARIGDFSIIPHLKQFAETNDGTAPNEIISSIRG